MAGDPMTAAAVLDAVPHRPPFRFIDEILELAGHRLRRGLTAAVVDHDAEALGGERTAARRADPGPTARHERHPCVAAHRYPSLALTDTFAPAHASRPPRAVANTAE